MTQTIVNGILKQANGGIFSQPRSRIGGDRKRPHRRSWSWMIHSPNDMGTSLGAGLCVSGIEKLEPFLTSNVVARSH